MSLKLDEIVGNIFYTKEKEKAAEAQKSAALQQKANNVFGTASNTATNALNPFLNKNGELFNPNLNYQKLLDNPNISSVAKKYIQQATGLSPTVTEQKPTVTEQKAVAPSTSGAYVAPSKAVQATNTSASGNTIADAANL